MLLMATLVTAGIGVTAPAMPASAAPGGSSSEASEDASDEDQMLNEVLESTGKRYTEAKSAVAKSTKKQADLSKQVKTAEQRRDALIPEVSAVAAQQYKIGGVSTASFLLNANSPDNFLDKAVSLNTINSINDHKLDELDEAINEVSTTKAALDAEVQQQKQNLQAMEKQKESAEKAFQLVGGETVTGGFVDAKSATAKAAPRNADGEFDAETCNQDDPTTNGCITKRTLNMYNEVRKAGFKRFVGCHRDGGPFEHPKGRACDWSLQESGFSPWHNQDTREYGNDLMAFAVRNADRLGILYVIWNKMIWFPATGWKSYHGVSDHTDHVHISML